MIYIGNHVSSSKGYEAMGKQEVALGGDTFAFFTRNPRGGSAKEIKDEDHGAEITCQFCQTHYHFDENDLEELIRDKS